MDGHGVMQVEKVGDATGYGKVYEGSQIESDVETLTDPIERFGRSDQQSRIYDRRSDVHRLDRKIPFIG